MRAMASASGSLRHLHVKGVGVQQGVAVAASRPYGLSRTPDRRAGASRRNGWPSAFFHHVGVARRGDARRLQRGLDQAGTIQPGKRLAAPDIGHAEKLLRHRDEIGRVFVQRRQMAVMDKAAAARSAR